MFDIEDYGVGPTDNGTYNVPSAAQPVNQQWDTGGGTLGQYSGDVFSILSQGIGAWSQYQGNQQLLDYKRFEATQGGVFMQGSPTQVPLAGTVTARATISPLMLMLIAGAAVLLLRK
jgi:hypothetical protein